MKCTICSSGEVVKFFRLCHDCQSIQDLAGVNVWGVCEAHTGSVAETTCDISITENEAVMFEIMER